ncbi:armadillo-type protein, partial [Helicostylum pulchrum]
MTDIEKQTQFEKIKHVSQSLLSHSAQVTRGTSKPIAGLLQTLYADLKTLQDPELVMSKPNIDLLLLPLITLYKAMTTQEKQGYEIIIEPWLQVMHFLLSSTLIKLWMPAKFTLELFSFFSNLLSPKYSDEIKYLAVLCLSGTLPAKYKEGRYNSFNQSVYFTLSKSFQTDAFLPMASPGIMALLLVIEQAQDIKLRLESLRVLSQLLFDNIHDADLLSVFFPGIVSRLRQTLTQRPKENHQIMCSSLKVLSELIETVVSDQDNSTLVEIDSFEAALSQTQEQPPPTNDPKKKRDKTWYTKSKQKLSDVMSQILKIRLYPDWRTRQAFVEFAFTLLSKCARTLDNCIQPLVEMMVLHMDDSYTEVSNTCKFRMQLLSNNPSFKDNIVPTLKQELYEWIMKFPKYMMSRDEAEKTNAISLIIGYILLLADQSSTVLSLVLDRASDGWMTALEIDKDSLNILEQKESQQFIELESEKSTPVYPKIRFRHLVTDLTTTKLTRLLNVIGKYCDLKNWIYHFMRYLSSDSNISNDPQAAYIVHSLLSGAFALDTDDWINDSEDLDHLKSKLKVITLDVLKDTMDLLIRATVNNSNSTTITTSSSSFQLDEESGYILTVCFGLQLIGLTSTILSQQDLQDQLITMLYPLLAHLGSSNLYIHTYALITLDSIALVCGLDSAKDLAIQNIDYIINMISQHISILSDNPRVPLVLKALIHVGGYASIGYLDDSVLEIYDALERHHSNDWLCIQLCSVLFEIIQTMEKNLPESTRDNVPELIEPEQGVSLEIKSFIQEEDDGVDKEYASMEEIGKYFLQRQAAGKHDEMTLEQSILDQSDLPMDLPTDTDKAEEEVESKTIPLTKEELMVKEIMDRSSHFLTASSPQLRSQMLILLTSGVSILSNHPTELNQLIHSIWIPILNRLKDPQNYVVLHAAHLIEKLSSVSTDFLSRKFIDDLWPQFKLLLRKSTVAAKNNTLSDYSVYSLYHRTLVCLFKTLTQIIYHVPINQPMVKEMLEEIKYYYKNDQVHVQLSSACQQLFNALSTQQPDTVWFYQTCFDTCKLVGPSSLLDPFIIPQWMQVPTKKSTEKVSSEKWDIII